MKHPALTRVLAIVLVLLCLAMGAAGGLGLTRAEKDRQSVLDDMTRLRGRIGEYRTVTESLEGRESYDERSETLEEKQAQHSKDSAEHRTELSTYTATQYGINMGIDAMDQADIQFDEYYAMFQRGKSAFNQGMGQASTLLSQLWTLYNAAMPVLQNANAHMDNARAVTAYLDSGGELTYGHVVGAYDELLRMADETAALIDTLRELTPTLDALAAFDPAALTGLSDSMGQVPASLAAFGTVSMEGYAQAGAPVDFDMNQLAQMQAAYNEYWAQIKQILAWLDEAAPQAEALVQQVTGMSVAEIRQRAQEARDDLAAQGDVPIDPEQNALLLEAYNANSAEIHQGMDQAGARLDEINGYAAQIGSFLSALQGQIDALNALMAQAEAAINQAGQALYEARTLIWWQMGQQRDKEEELRRQKEELDQAASELQQLSDQAEEQKTLEQQQRSLRAMLLARDEIRERYEAGEEPDAAALRFAEESETKAEGDYRTRRLACLLMLAGAALGVLGIPAAFEALRSRFMLLAPVLLCLGCAAGAERVLWNMGRGHSYSCLAVAGFALLQLLVSIPKKKTGKRPGKHLKTT